MIETLGDRAKRLRKAANLSAAEVARRVSPTFGQNSIYKIESGETKNPEFSTGLRIAAALGVDPWFLAFGRERASMQSVAGVSFFAGPETESRSLEVAALVKAEVDRQLEGMEERLQRFLRNEEALSQAGEHGKLGASPKRQKGAKSA